MTAGREHIIVVGNGMACHALCRALVQAPAERRPKLTIFGEEPQPAYNRIRLSELWDSSDPCALELSPKRWYAEHDIELVCGERVTRIDRDACEVHTDHGRRLGYDRLILATGSSAIRPPIAGIDDPACHVYRSLADLGALRAAATVARRAAVLGGGLLGLEAAKLLHDAGLEVEVIEAADGLMLRQLDLMSAQCLRDHVERLGVAVRVGTLLSGIERDADALTLRFGDGSALVTDLVVVATGVRPRDELAAAAGLACGVRGGVIVDESLTSSDPRIYAVGECASHHGRIVGLFEPCQDMARVLAERLLGAATSYRHAAVSCRLKLLGVDVVAVGDYGNEHPSHAYAEDGCRRTLLVEQGVIVGAIGVGSWPELAQIERMIAQRSRVSQRALQQFRDKGRLFTRSKPLPVASWPDHALVCNCARVSAGALREHMRQGVYDAAVLAALTGVSVGCGSCKPVLGELLGNVQLLGARSRSFGLMWLSLLALGAVLLTAAVSPIAFATSVSAELRPIDSLWRETPHKQLTGFVILGVSALGLVLTLRKRAHWPKLGELNLYRALHGTLGVLTLVTLFAHTGLRLGNNLNFALMLSFLGANLLGAAVGVVASLEMKSAHPLSALGRRLRPVATSLHILLLWPLPLLIGLHVMASYYF